MTNKRIYWLTDAIANLDQAYNSLEATQNLVPQDEDFDITVEEHLHMLHDLRTSLQHIRKNLK